MAEGQRLQRINRTAKDRVRLRRAMIVLASAQGWPVPDIADLAQVSQRYVRQVIHDFNGKGSMRWTQNGAGAHPRRSMTPRGRGSARSLGATPRPWTQPFSTWLLTKLCDYLIETGIVASPLAG